MRWSSNALGPASVVLLVVLLGGCRNASSDQAKEPEVSSPSPSTPSSTSPEPPEEPSEEPSAEPSPESSEAAGKAVADLASRLGIGASAIEVVGEEPVTWSDGSLGCAKPGFAYTQALVEGTRITLQAEGASYEYHTGGRSQQPLWCESPTE